MIKIFIFITFNILIFKFIKNFYLFNLIFILTFLSLINLNFNLSWINLYYLFRNDFISFNLSILSIYISRLILIYYVNKKINYYLFIILSLLFILLLTFNSINYFLFYLFFEIRLIPTFFLIIGWGYQPERIQASIYILLYTLFASLPLLIIIFLLFNKFNTLFFLFINNNLNLFNNNNLIFYFYIIFAFLVKLPTFLFHLWLPKAHVEAPVTGSIILAGIILKLGGYGLYRSIIFIINYCKKFNLFIITLGLLGILNLRITCLQQNDLKSLVAYSSIVHIILILIGLFSIKKFGIIGSLIIIIGHGLCSSGLFYLVNLNYEKLKTRNFFIIKGIILLIPSLSIWWFLFCSRNIAAPPRINLLRELIIFKIILNWRFNIFLILIFIILVRIIYRLYLFSYRQHGNYNNYNNKFLNINNLNFLNLLLHWLPLNLLFLKSNFFN